MTTPLETALAYIARGWNPVPVDYRSKKPKLGKSWQTIIIDTSSAPKFFNGAQMNIGVQLGPNSHGLTDVDLDCDEAIAVAPYVLPRTAAIFGRETSRNSHWLFYTELAQSIPKATLEFNDPKMRNGKDALLLELRIGPDGHAAQTVAPPSTHKDTGEVIKWEVSGEPAVVDGEDLHRRAATVAAYALLARYWPAEGGGHHSAALTVGGFLARTGLHSAAVGLAVEAIAKAIGTTRWKDLRDTANGSAQHFAEGQNVRGFPAMVETFGKEVATKVADWLDYSGDRGTGIAAGKAVPAPGQKRAPANVEDATALEFAQMHADNFRYVAEASRWMKWHGNRWCTEKTLSAFDESRKLCRKAGDARGKTVAAVVALARTDRSLAATADQWDHDPDLLNAASVTVDLCSGMPRTPKRGDFITKIAAVDPAPPGEPHPLWTEFLRRVTADNGELIRFLQRYLGYCLTAHTHEHVLAFLHGTGANGKGVFINTVSRILGDYSLTAPMEMFLASKHERHPTEIARLHGARLVTVQETQKGRAWDEAKIKTLTSEDKLTGHFMRQDFFDFVPTHKLMFSSNHKPTLRTADEAMRRRFLLVPFTVEIPREERDPQLPEKLRAEWPAILGWMVDGCLDWRRNGLMVPAIVKAATDEYLQDQDSLGEWIAEWIVRDERNFVALSELFGHWKQWSERRNQNAGTERSFASDLADKGFARDRDKKSRGFKGIALKQPGEPELWGASGDAR